MYSVCPFSHHTPPKRCFFPTSAVPQLDTVYHPLSLGWSCGPYPCATIPAWVTVRSADSIPLQLINSLVPLPRRGRVGSAAGHRAPRFLRALAPPVSVSLCLEPFPQLHPPQSSPLHCVLPFNTKIRFVFVALICRSPNAAGLCSCWLGIWKFCSSSPAMRPRNSKENIRSYNESENLNTRLLSAGIFCLEGFWPNVLRSLSWGNWNIFWGLQTEKWQNWGAFLPVLIKLLFCFVKSRGLTA